MRLIFLNPPRYLRPLLSPLFWWILISILIGFLWGLYDLYY